MTDRVQQVKFLRELAANISNNLGMGTPERLVEFALSDEGRTAWGIEIPEWFDDFDRGRLVEYVRENLLNDLTDRIYTEVFGHLDDKRFHAEKAQEIYDWLANGDVPEHPSITQLAQEWREYDIAPESETPANPIRGFHSTGGNGTYIELDDGRWVDTVVGTTSETPLSPDRAVEKLLEIMEGENARWVNLETWQTWSNWDNDQKDIDEYCGAN